MPSDDLIANLRAAYDLAAERRNASPVEDWKAGERAAFLSRLSAEGCRTLLDVGSGPGIHGSWFRDHGMEVTCTDLSPEHVRLCHEKGLEAYVMPLLELDFGERTFDAAFALNCLLHVPRADLPAALGRIHAVLRPGALFFLGQYGGEAFEGVRETDPYEPKRFFSFLPHEQIRAAATSAGFDLIDFHTLAIAHGEAAEFQALTLRR